MKTLRRIFRTIDLVATDAYQAMKVLVMPLYLFALGVVTFSLASVVACTLIGQQQLGIELFLNCMNLTRVEIRTELRMLLVSLNWFALFTGLVWVIYSAAKYIADVQYRVSAYERIRARNNLSLLKKSEESADDFKQAGNA